MKAYWLKGLIVVVATLVLLILIGIWLLPPQAQQNERAHNSPVKPPNCSDVFDLTHLKLSDGRLADVRIVQIRNTKLYVPTDWLVGNLVDYQAEKFGPAFAYDILEQFSPDIHKNECPGIVHTLNPHGATPRFGIGRGSFVYFGLGGNFAPKEVGGSGGRMVGFSVTVQATTMTDGTQIDRPRISSVGNYWIKGNRDFFLLIGGATSDERRPKYDAELRKLAIWLMKPPSTRLNDRVFFAMPDF